MVVGPGPERKEVVQTPRELVAGVGIDGLKQTENDPHIHGDNVQLLGKGTEHNGNADGSKGKNHGFQGRGIFGCEAKGGAVLVMQFVNHLVEARSMKGAVQPVVPSIFQDKEQGNLPRHGDQRRKRNRGRQATVLSHGVEQPDLRKLDGEVGEENESGAGPLFRQCRHFLLQQARISLGSSTSGGNGW